MGGLEFLSWLAAHPEMRVIPTIVMSASKLERDVAQAYALGANSYFVKPGGFDELVSLVGIFYDYWKRAVRPIENR
jgi:CheY-like chemotaxis protein